MKTWMVPALAATLLLGACGSADAESPSGVIAADPWVRSTDDSERPDMSSLFVNLTNPTADDITLVSADCGDVAGMVELHVMEMTDGQMVMKKAEDGVVVPKESHQHLAPGGPHVMLMDLARELPAGSEEITCSLTFDNDQSIDVVAPVKEFTEEQDTYHTHEEDEADE